jgi:hypothetical protein
MMSSQFAQAIKTSSPPDRTCGPDISLQTIYPQAR